MKHLYTTYDYKYQKLIDGKFVDIVGNKDLTKGSIVKVFDVNTGEQLGSEQGEKTFELSQDYDGLHRIPFFK
jgi:hypothetical protein